MNISHFELLTTMVSKDKGFMPVKREKIKHQKMGRLYPYCTSLALSVWDSTTVKNSMSAPALLACQA